MTMLAICAHSLCVLGAYIACRRSFKTYIAIISLINYAETDPSLPLPESSKDSKEKNIDGLESESDAQREEPVIRRQSTWRRILNSNLVPVIILILATLAFSMFLLYGLPKVTSKAVTMIIWIMMSAYTITLNMYETVKCILPQPKIEKLVIQGVDNGEVEKKYRYNSTKIPRPNQSPPTYTTKPFITTLACILSGSIVISAYYRNLWISSLVGFGQVITFAGRTFYPKVKIRFALKLVLGFLAIAIAASQVASHFFPGKPKTEQREKDLAIPMWLLDVYMMYNAGIGMMLPAALLAITQRFEYMKSSSYMENRPIAKEGEIETPIPNKDVPNFRTPITTMGFISLILGLVVYHALSPRFIGQETNQYLSIIGIMFFAFPVTASGMVVTAWYTGNLEAWLDYQDKWYPNVKDHDGLDQEDQEEETKDLSLIDDHLVSLTTEKDQDTNKS